MVETTTFTTAETPTMGFTTKQRFLASCGIFDMQREETNAALKAFIESGQKKLTPEIEKMLEQAQFLANNCHELFAQLSSEEPHAELMQRYASVGMEFALHRAECYRMGRQKAFIEKVTDSDAVEKIAQSAWLDGGFPRQRSVQILNALIPIEAAVVNAGYRAITIEQFDETAIDESTKLPRLVYGSMFQQRAEGEPKAQPALDLKRTHQKLRIDVGTKIKRGKLR